MNFTCADCPTKNCRFGKLDQLPTVCPTKEMDKAWFQGLYNEEDLAIAHNAALTEARGYCRQTRLEETMAFAYRMGYKKIGIGFCVGLSREAKMLADILRENGFLVEAISCKHGSVEKAFVDISQKDFVNKCEQFEIMCNPAGQAELLCKRGVDLCVILGLCVGHDTLFIRHCEKPVTVLSSKDRVMGHNPMAALYVSDSYLKRVHTFIQDNFPEEP